MNVTDADNDHRTRVAIRHGEAPASMALEALREAVAPGHLKNRRVLVKPNAGFAFGPGSGVITHHETVRGVIRFCREAGAGEIWVGDSSIFGLDTDEVLEITGVAQVARDEGVRPVNLDSGEPVTVRVADPMAIDRFRISSLALEADVIISVPVMKTHMHAGASLGIKNMKGCLYKRQKRRLHHLSEEDRFIKWHDYKNLDRAIADLFGVLPPSITVIDGVVALEGLGPALGDPKPMQLVLASRNPLNAEIAGLFLMGLSLRDVPHVELCAIGQGSGIPEFDELNLDHSAFRALRSPFRPAVVEDISSAFPQFECIQGNSCSACDGTLTAFLKSYGEEYAGRGPIKIALGQDLNPDRIDPKTILLGKCTANMRERGHYLEGCPPVPSYIRTAIGELEEKADPDRRNRK